MLGDIVDLDAEVAGAAIDIQRADLEDRPGAARVEIAERDEVVEQRHQVAHIAGELFDRGDRFELRRQRRILGAQRGDSGAAGGRKSGVGGKRVEVRVEHGGDRDLKKKKKKQYK